MLYDRETLTATRGWLNAAFDRQQAGFVDARGGALALLFGGLLALG